MDLGSGTPEPAWARRLARSPFAASLARGAPLVALGGEPARVVFASPAALALFGAADAAELDWTLFSNNGFGARRLARLVRETPASAAARLETLTFYIARKPVTLRWICARLAHDGESWLLAAEPVAQAEPQGGQVQEVVEPAPAAAAPAVEEPAIAVPSVATPPMAAAPLAVAAPVAEAPASRAPVVADAPAAAAAFELRPLDGPVRFVWRLDGEGRFGPPDEALSKRLGPLAPRPGETIDELTERARLGDSWAQAFARKATFSALRLAWPEPGFVRARATLVSGAPVFERGEDFSGFRGFGVFTGEAVELATGKPWPDAATLVPEELAPEEPAAAPAARVESPAPTAGDAAPKPERAEAEAVSPPEAAAFDGPAGEELAFAAAADLSAQTGDDVAPTKAEAAVSVHSPAGDEPAPAPSGALAEAPIEAALEPTADLESGLEGGIEPEPPQADAAAPRAGGDATALISMLQRQHAPLPAAAPPQTPAPAAPALAIISALAQLLQPKTPSQAAKPAPGAEIVQLRPPAANDVGARDGATVALSSQERDAFKEIARALGANVRGARADDAEAAQGEAHEAEPSPTEAAPAASSDLAGLLDILPIAALVIRDGEALYANSTLLDLTGYRDLEDFRRRDGLKAIFRGREPEALAPGGAVGGIPLVAAGGRLMTVDAQVRQARWQGGPATLVAMRRSFEADHQDEIRALERETAMHAARARDFATVLDAARDGMVRLDHSGRLLGLNKGAEALFGYNQNEVAGESFLTLFAPAGQATAGAALDRLARGESGPVESFEAPARDRAGRVFPASIDIGRIAHQPEPDYFLLLSDRTELESGGAAGEAARAEAEKTSAAKTELLSRVSHEMRTPLHAIMGFAEVILEERFGPIGNERYRDYIRDIHSSSKHVLSLANDLLDLTRIELGKLELEFAPIDVNRIIRECVTLMQPQAARERIIMRLSLFDRLPNVMADERSLRQIMLNLMSNAVKYNEPGGQVIVSTAIDDAGAAIVRVRDTGVGMNESELAIALEPFRRVPGAKAVEGAGLGLPLTKALVEANHADFTIKSRKDQGTLVEIAFPVRHAAQ